MTFPQLYDPSGDRSAVSSRSTLLEFFTDWYLPRVRDDKSRKPVSESTLKRRHAAVQWWTRLMGSKKRIDDSPSLLGITQQHLTEFKKLLTECTYQRGGIGSERRTLSPMSQMRTLQEIHIVLGATGPPDGTKIRAGLIQKPPKIYIEPVNMFPKPTWTLDEAIRIAQTAGTCDPPESWSFDRQAWHALARATVAIFFYTGHRATTYERLQRNSLHQVKPGLWVLDIIQSVKTGKMDRVPVHRQLLSCLQEVQKVQKLANCSQLIPWPVKYRAVAGYHERWQVAAGLPADRRFSPQAWRRLHAESLQQSVYDMANRLASQSLGHSNSTTTQDHYSLSAARLYMPDLFSRQQRLF